MHLSAKCWEAKRGRTMGLKVRMSWGRRNLPPVDITKFDVHVGVRLCREANPHRALSMHPQQMTDTCEGSKRAQLWVPQSTQNKTTIPKKKDSNSKNIRGLKATNRFLNSLPNQASRSSWLCGLSARSPGESPPAHYNWL